jgi:hypothetical protein
MIADYSLEYLAQVDDLCGKAEERSSKAVEESDRLDELAKDMLASLMSKIDAQGDSVKLSELKLERLARTSREWTQFQNGRFAARSKAAEYKVKAKVLDRHWQSVISGLAFRREEIKRSIAG